MMRALYEAPLFLAVVIAAVLFHYAWRRRPTPGAGSFALLMLACGGWALSIALEILSYNSNALIFWAKLEFLWITIIPSAAFVLILTYTRFSHLVNRRLYAILLIEPILVNLAVWTNPFFHLIWSYEEVIDTGQFLLVNRIYQPLYFVHVSYSYLLILSVLIIFIYTQLSSARFYLRQTLALAGGIFFPFAYNITYNLVLDPVLQYDLTPVLLAFTGPLLAWGLFRSQLFNILPVAYHTLIESMGDGVVVLNDQNRVVALNPAAEQITGRDQADSIGLPVENLFYWRPELKNSFNNLNEVRTEVTSRDNEAWRCFDLRVTPMFDRNLKINGRLLVIRDITQLKQAEEVQKRRNTELSALHATLLDITASRDLPTLLRTIIERATHLLDAYGGSLYLCDPDKQEVRCVVSYNNPRNNIGHTLSYEEGESGLVARTGKPLVIDDYRAWPGRLNKFQETTPIIALISVPMIWQGQVTGVINVMDVVEKRHFTSNDLDLIMMLASQVSVAVENTRLLEAERQQRERAEILREVTGALSSNLDKERVLQTILEQLSRLVQYDSASLMLVSGQDLVVVSHRGLHADLEKLLTQQHPLLKHTKKVIESRCFDIIPDTHLDPDWVSVNGAENIRSWLGVPLLYQDKAIGLLNLDKNQTNFYTENDAAQAMVLAAQAAVTIENVRLYDAAERRAQEAETLRRATAVVVATLSQDEAIERILEQLDFVVPYDSASVQLYLNGYLEVVGGRGWPDPQAIMGLRFHVPGDNPNTTVVLERRPVIVNNTSTFSSFDDVNNNNILSWLGVPLIVHDRVIGIVTVDSNKKNYFTPDHARLVSAFADQVAIAIENARLYSAEKERVEELDALRATIADISSELELPRLLQAILEHAINFLNATGGELGLYDENRAELNIVACHQMGKNYVGVRLGLGDGVMGRVAQTRQPLIINDYQHWQGQYAPYRDGPWKSVLAVPLLIGGRLLGVVGVVDTSQARQFVSTEQRLLNLFAQQAAIAVENARLYQSAKEAADRRAILHKASQEVVAASLEPERIYTAIHQAAAKLMPSEAFAITLLDETSNEVDCIYIIDHMGRAPAVRIPADRGLSGHVIATGESLYIEDMLTKLDSIDSIRVGDREEVRSILAVPIRLGEKVMGMLSTQSYQPGAYTPEDQRLLEMLASYAGIALSNARLFNEVQKLAITDSLTGVFNHRQLFDLGQREFLRSLRFVRPFTAIMVDIDNFKKVNDTYGHPTGNVALQVLCQRIQSQIREIDILGRYGGEEFVVLLPETNSDSAFLVAERLRNCFDSQPIPTERGLVSITISLGVAEIKADIPDFATLIARADTAMYQAKASGKNRVEISQ